MLHFYKISGHSLDPHIEDGDFVIASKIPIWLRGYKPGELVVFQDDVYGIMVKIIDQVDKAARKLNVKGTSEYSLDSRQLGPVPFPQVRGILVCHIPKKKSIEKKL